ncbi:DUF2007 domain-containing protein [Haloferula sargassicola]|uniref:DUF2007 domain-containing protein n=1 Tax=Haloferula sargassicola TaxID=490096 RepID=A0ABP9UPW6_9BACT
MKKVYDNIEFARVGHFQSILESEGIATLLKNEAMSSVFRGSAGLYDLAPELWAVNDDDYERAAALLEPLLEDEPPAGSPWICPTCGEDVSGNFDECWNCQTRRPEMG